jgi:medium-chain acyl-[acyl-carrier-protein] hydrolase
MLDLVNTGSWLIRKIYRSRPRVRLFCFHYAGGGASIFQSWSHKLPSDIEVYAVQLPGRETRFGERPFTSLLPLVDKLCRVIYPYINIPYVFFGHSMGALVSFELAQMICKRYGKSPEHLFVSGRLAPHLQSSKPQIHQLPPAEFLEEIRLLNGTPDSILNNKELMELIIPILRADFAVCETYQYQPSEPLTCPITVIGGNLDKSVDFHRLQSWQQHTTNHCSLHILDGDHFFVNTCQSEVLKIIVKCHEADLKCQNT